MPDVTTTPAASQPGVNPHLAQYVAKGLKGRILSGVQPTGNLHLGNYLGAIRNWVGLQAQHDCFYMVVDYHAITADFDPKTLGANTLQMARDLMACGIDPARCRAASGGGPPGPCPVRDGEPDPEPTAPMAAPSEITSWPRRCVRRGPSSA